MSKERKMQGPPPEGYPTIDDQAISGNCVRFAISKAIASHLFKNKIDVEQNSIMHCLVQEKKSICGIRVDDFDKTSLCLQDVRNTVKKNSVPNQSWWEV